MKLCGVFGGVIDRLDQKGLVTLIGTGDKRRVTLRPMIAALQDGILPNLTTEERAQFSVLALKPTGVASD